MLRTTVFRNFAKVSMAVFLVFVSEAGARKVLFLIFTLLHVFTPKDF